MIFRKFTSLLTILTLLFTLVPFNYMASAELLQDDLSVVTSPEINLAPAAAVDPFVVFDAQVSSDISRALSYNTSNLYGSVSSDASGALSGSHSLRLNHTAISAGNQFEAKISQVSVSDITAYSYININMWSPEATDEKLNVLLLNSGKSGKRIRYILNTDWAGWKTVTIPYSSHSNNSLTSLTTTVNRFNINIGGWNFTKTKAGYFLVDKVWLTNTIPAGASISSAEYENGAVFVPEDLGGDKTFSFTFDKALAPIDMTSVVTFEKYNGTGYDILSDGYTARGNGNKLDVEFSSNLPDATYKISLNPKNICTSDYVFGSGDKVSYEFSVNMPSPYFSLTSSSITEGNTLQTAEELILSFNNDLDSSLYIPDYISIYRDGDKIYNSFTSSVDGKDLTLDFGTGLEEGHSYVIGISSSYTDDYGNFYIGDSEISFTIEAQAETSKLVVFTAAESANFDILDSEYTLSTDITNLYSQTAKLEYQAGDADLHAYIAKKSINTTGMKYLNFLAYSPVVTENPAYVLFRNGSTVVGNKYELIVDWSGWKLISIPLSSISTTSPIGEIAFAMACYKHENTTSGYVLFDAVWFSKDKPSELMLETQSFPDNFTSAAPYGQTLSLTFTAELDAYVIPDILVSDSSGNPFTDYTYSINGKNLDIVFGTLGSSSEQYTFTLSSLASQDFSLLSEPVVIKFSSADSGIFVNDFTYSSKTVNAVIENLSSQSKNLTLVALAIGEDNTLVEKKQADVSASAGITNASVTFTSAETISQVKAFVLNEKSEYVSSKYFSYKNEASQIIPVTYLSGDDSAIENVSYDVNVNVLTLNASLSSLPDAALVEISSSGEIISANVVSAANGLTYNYVFPSGAQSGIYPAKISAAGVSTTVNIKYVSRQDRDAVLLLANSGTSFALAAKLKELKAYLPISSVSDILVDDFAKILVMYKPYTDYDDVIDFINSLNSFVNTFNSSQWSNFSELIENNDELLKKINSDVVTYYTSLTGTNRGMVSQLLLPKLPALSITDLVSKLSLAVEEYKLTLIPDTSVDDTIHTGSPSVSGGSVGGASFGTATNPPQTGTSGSNGVFTDLGSVLWAEDSINLLTEKGIISKAADGRFRPDDNITREEFTKLIVCAFLTVNPEGTVNFSDAAAGAWYNSYLSSAYAAGIVSGYPDGSFGIGQNITREDMAVLCMRAFVATGRTLSSSVTPEFSDKNHIAPYAVEYVEAMASAGIINGMGDGTFAPKANATRAQAAKIIAALIEIN